MCGGRGRNCGNHLSIPLGRELDTMGQHPSILGHGFDGRARISESCRHGTKRSFPGETWQGIDVVLQRRTRGSRGPDSLDRLLQRHEWFLLNRDNYPPAEGLAAGPTDVAAA